MNLIEPEAPLSPSEIDEIRRRWDESYARPVSRVAILVGKLEFVGDGLAVFGMVATQGGGVG